MRQRVFTSVLLMIFAAVCVLPALAEDARQGQPPTTSAGATTTTSTTDDAKKTDQEKKDQEEKDRKEKDRKEKELLEYKARREAEMRKRHERRNSNPGSGTVIVIENPGGGGGGGDTGSGYDYDPVRERPRFTAGIVFAPSQRGKKPAFGVQYLGSNKLGAMAWIPTGLDYGDDVIDASIPHNDYWLDGATGTYALQAICGFGSKSAMLILGAGLAVDQTKYTAVSNVTGWQWKAGSGSSVKIAGQASLRLHIADRFSLQFGYDTSQYAFLGLAGSF